MTSVFTSGNIERLKNESNEIVGSTFGYVGGHSTSNKIESFPPLKYQKTYFVNVQSLTIFNDYVDKFTS